MSSATTTLPPARRLRSKANLTEALTLSASKPNIYRDTSLSSSSSRTSTTAPSDIRSIAFSPTGSLIATADSRILRVWNTQKPDIRFSTELKPPANDPATPKSSKGPSRAHLTGTERVAWNTTKEAELASAGNDGFVRFWDVRTRGQVVGSVKFEGEAYSLAWRPERAGGDEVVVLTRDDRLVSMSRRDLSVISSVKQPIRTNQINFTNAGNHLLLPRTNGAVDVVAYPSLENVVALPAHTSAAHIALQDPRGRHILTGGSDALVTLWTTDDFACKRTYSEMCTGVVKSLSFSFDGCFVVAGDIEGGTSDGLSVVHAESGDEVYRLKTGGQGTPLVQWHPNRYWIAYTGGGEGGALKVVGPSGGYL